MWARIVGQICLGAALMGVGLGFFIFDAFPAASARSIDRAAAAIVFTGAFERVDAGLQLAEARAVPRLFISGANSGAGIFPGRFVPMFSERNPNIKDLPELLACCVELGEAANTTLENALEARSWVRGHNISGPLALVTSRLHMARALTLLTAVMRPDTIIIPYPVEDRPVPAEAQRERALEYAKFLVTLVAVQFPWLLERPRLTGGLAKEAAQKGGSPLVKEEPAATLKGPEASCPAFRRWMRDCRG